jgi:AraC family transcriptional regulator
LAMSLVAELQSGGAMGELYAETLGASLAVHLLRKYSIRRSAVPERSGGLSRRQLLRALDYIQAHLGENLALEAIAKAAGISPFHFARLFKQSMHETPHRYVLRCRVGRAKELLLQQDLPICAVASQAGFCDQSHLTFHFKRSYGVTPKAFLRMHAVGR